jgi:N-acyl homoserine lactone hydrolase
MPPALASNRMSVKAETRPLTAPLPGAGKPGTTVVVEPLLGAEVQLPRRFMESDGGRLALLRGLGIGTPRSKWWWAPIPAYLIHHPGAGPILVDTAMHPSVDTRPAANLGRTMAAMARFRMPAGDLSTQLRGRGIEPKEIRTVLLTHLHLDHSSGIAELPNATFVLSEREWEAATTIKRPFLHGYRRAHFDYLFDYRTIDFDGPLIDSYASFGRTFDLFGDGSIRLALTSGHTAGHMSVIARLREHDFVIAGDAVYTEDQLAGRNVPPRPEDMHQWQRSRRELQRFAERFSDAVIVPGHDPGAWEKLAERYE